MAKTAHIKKVFAICITLSKLSVEVLLCAAVVVGYLAGRCNRSRTCIGVGEVGPGGRGRRRVAKCAPSTLETGWKC